MKHTPGCPLQAGVRGERAVPRPRPGLEPTVAAGPRHESVRRAGVEGLRGAAPLQPGPGAPLAPPRLRLRGPRLRRRAPQGAAPAGSQSRRQLGRQERGPLQLGHQHG